MGNVYYRSQIYKKKHFFPEDTFTQIQGFVVYMRIAVHLLKKTGNLRQVQKQLGHASPATTANMYAYISFEDMQNGVKGQIPCLSDI